MFNIDIQNGVAQFTPPAVVAGEVASRVYGLSINEWFYICAIFCMFVSTLSSAYVAVLKSKASKKEKAE